MFIQPGYAGLGRSAALLFAGSLVFAAGFAAGNGGLGVREGRASVQPDGPWPNRAGYSAEVLRVNDGDTFEARVQIWPGTHVTTKVRLRGIDTPERRAQCAQEHRKAVAATEMLSGILAERRVRITNVDLDKYGGRVLADVSTRRTPDVAAALLQAGLARRYEGGHRQSWCAQATSH